MDHRRIYNLIIEKRKSIPIPNNVYGEIHHIIPRCLGGADSKNNLIRITAREHFICHALLAEMYPVGSIEWIKLNKAFIMMKCGATDTERYINSRYYELKKTDFSIAMSYSQKGILNSQYGKIWVYSMCLRHNLKIEKSMLGFYIDNGYTLGRVMNFDNFINKLNKPTKSNIEKTPIKRVKKEAKVKVKIDKSIIFEDIKFSNYKIASINKLFNVKIINSDDLKIIKNKLLMLYYDEKLSLPHIAKIYNTNHVTILNYFKTFKIERRNLSDAISNSFVMLKDN